MNTDVFQSCGQMSLILALEAAPRNNIAGASEIDYCGSLEDEQDPVELLGTEDSVSPISRLLKTDPNLLTFPEYQRADSNSC